MRITKYDLFGVSMITMLISFGVFWYKLTMTVTNTKVFTEVYEIAILILPVITLNFMISLILLMCKPVVKEKRRRSHEP